METFLALPQLQLVEKSSPVFSRLEKTADSPQLQFINIVVDIPFVPQTQILMVQTIQQTTEFPRLLYVSVGRCPCVVLVVLAMPRSCRQRQFAPKAGYAGFDAPQLCSSWLLQAKIFGILASMTRRTVAVVCARLVLLVTVHLALCSFWFPRPDALHHGSLCRRAQNCGNSTVAVHHGRRQPFLEIAVAVRFLSVDVPVVLVVQILRWRCGEDFLAPTVQLAEKIVARRKLQFFRSCSSSWSSTSLSRCRA